MYTAKDLYLAVSAAMIDLDSNARRWTWDYTDGQTDPSLQAMLNLAMMEIVYHRPDASAVIESVQLDSGVKQTLPANSLALLGIICNMGSDGNTRGKRVEATDKPTLDAIDPDWYAGSSATAIKQYVYDRLLDSQTWYCYPGVSDSQDVYVEISRSKVPTQISSQDDDLSINDVWFSPLYHAVLYQVFTGDSGEGSFNRGIHHLERLLSAIGAKNKTDLSFLPQPGE